MKSAGGSVVLLVGLCCAGASAKGPQRETVTVVARESSTTPYDWQMNGRISVSCYGNTCSGYYTSPTSGTQQINGAVLRLQRSDASIAIAQCVSKVNIFSSVMVAIDALNVGDPNTPTVYRDCREPDPSSVVEAEFHSNTVKLYWHGIGSSHGYSETYSLLGFLRPSISQPAIASSVRSEFKGLNAYRYPSKGFIASFPSEPQPLLTPRFEAYSYNDPSVSLVAGVGRSQAEPLDVAPDTVLQANKTGALNRSNARLISERRISLGIYPGIEFESETDTVHFSTRIFLVGPTLYQVVVAAPIGRPYAERSQFLDSFHLIAREAN